MKSITIEHPKTVTKLFKPIKQPQVITQQQETVKKYKVKDYRKTKTTGCQQELEIARRHDNLPQNCSQLYEIKIPNFKHPDEQLKLTRLCIKNEFFEITKEFKDFKFKQNLRLEFEKEEKVLKEIMFLDRWPNSYKKVYNDITIDKLLDKQQNDLSVRIENWTHEGSGQSIHSILRHERVISEIAPCEGSSYFALPEELNNSAKGLINIQNDDNECFRWFLARYLNPVDKNPAIIINAGR